MTLGTVLTILLAIQLFSFLLGLLFDSQLMFQISWYSLFFDAIDDLGNNWNFYWLKG